MSKSTPLALIIDPDDNLYTLAQLVFSKQELIGSIKHVYTGFEAIDYLVDCQEMKMFPKLVVVNLDLPDMSGVNLIRSLVGMRGFDRSNIHLMVIGSDLGATEPLAEMGIERVYHRSAVPEFFKTFSL